MLEAVENADAEVTTSMTRDHRGGTRSRERMKSLFEAYNGPQRGLLLAPLALLLLYDQE